MSNGISAKDFENPPPKSLDPEAAERVRRTTSKRDRRQKAERERPSVEEVAAQSQQKIEASKQFENPPPSSIDKAAAERIREGKRLEEIDRLSQQGVLVQRASQRRVFTSVPRDSQQRVSPRVTKREPDIIRDRVTRLSTATIKPERKETKLTPFFDLGREQVILTGGFLTDVRERITKERTKQDIALQRSPVGSSERDVAGAKGTGLGLLEGAVVVAEVASQPQQFIFPTAQALIVDPLGTGQGISRELGTIGERAKVATPGEQSVFLGETLASAGVESGLINTIGRPLTRKIGNLRTKLDPSFRPVKEVPITRTIDVKGFDRTIIKDRKPGEPLPNNFVIATDDLVAVETPVKSFQREIPTGETRRVIKDIPKEEGSFDIELAGGVSSTEESLSGQISLAGTKQDIVSGQRSLIDKPDQLIGKTKETITDLTKPSTDPLEESFFFDPRGRLRQSRVFGDPENTRLATPEEFVTGTGKEVPEIVFIPDAEIASFPSNLQKPVEFIIKEGRQRPGETVSQSVSRVRSGLQERFPGAEKDIVQFQLETKGQPTVPGFFSGESETIFSSGQRGEFEKVGVTLLEDPSGQSRRVNIFKAKIGEAPASDQVNKLVSDESFVASQSEKFIENVVNPRTRTIERVINPDVSLGISGRLSSSRESPSPVTSQSLTGLEVNRSAEPPSPTQVLTGPTSSSISKDFRPPVRPSLSIAPDISRAPDSVIPPTIRPGRVSGGGSRRIPGSPDPGRITSLFPSSSARVPRVERSPRRTPITPTIDPPPRTPITPTIDPPPRRVFIPRVSREKPRGERFFTQVLKQGKFVTVGVSTTLIGATRRGVSTVGGSALRTFRIKKGQRTVRPTNTFGFRRSKSRPGSIVEKSIIAINTPGEFTEITGASVRKRRRENRGLFI